MIISPAHPDQRRVLATSSPITLGPYDSSPRTARASARAQLSQWGRPELGDDLEAVVSELVTNAVHASESTATPVAVRLVLTSASLFVEVFDSAPGVPVAAAAGAESECGRGLRIVAALARDWGWTPTANGKVTWAEIGS